MKRIYLFNWEIASQICIAGTHTILKRDGTKFIFPEKGSQLECKEVYITFLVQPENIIDDTETVLIPE